MKTKVQPTVQVCSVRLRASGGYCIGAVRQRRGCRIRETQVLFKFWLSEPSNTVSAVSQPTSGEPRWARRQMENSVKTSQKLSSYPNTEPTLKIKILCAATDQYFSSSTQIFHIFYLFCLQIFNGSVFYSSVSLLGQMWCRQKQTLSSVFMMCVVKVSTLWRHI